MRRTRSRCFAATATSSCFIFYFWNLLTFHCFLILKQRQGGLLPEVMMMMLPRFLMFDCFFNFWNHEKEVVSNDNDDHFRSFQKLMLCHHLLTFDCFIYFWNNEKEAVSNNKDRFWKSMLHHHLLMFFLTLLAFQTSYFHQRLQSHLRSLCDQKVSEKVSGFSGTFCSSLSRFRKIITIEKSVLISFSFCFPLQECLAFFIPWQILFLKQKIA